MPNAFLQLVHAIRKYEPEVVEGNALVLIGLRVVALVSDDRVAACACFLTTHFLEPKALMTKLRFG